MKERTKQGNSRTYAGDLSSDESSYTSYDSGRYTDSSRSCSSRNSYVTNNLSRQELARRGVELFRQVKVWLGGQGRDGKTDKFNKESEHNRMSQEIFISEKDQTKPNNKKVVIQIGSHDRQDQVKSNQTHIYTKPTQTRKSYDFAQCKPSNVILPDSLGTVTIPVPFTYKEEIFHV